MPEKLQSLINKIATPITLEPELTDLSATLSYTATCLVQNGHKMVKADLLLLLLLLPLCAAHRSPQLHAVLRPCTHPCRVAPTCAEQSGPPACSHLPLPQGSQTAPRHVGMADLSIWLLPSLWSPGCL